MKRYEPKRWQDAAKERKDVAALELAAPEAPRQTFKEDTFVLEDATRKVEFRYLGWAHTRGDGFVYLPKEKILCTGDAVANGPYNYMGDGNSANWTLVIEKARQLDVTSVLPGHGPPAGKEVLSGQAQFFVELRTSVADAIRSGKKLEDLITRQGQKTVATSITLPASVQNWVDKEGLAADVEVVYKEMTTGKPHGEILGGRQGSR
jgi:cyclase